MGIQIGGLASGMDTEKMIKDLMRAERVRVDKYYRQEEAIKWQQEALNTTNKTLAEFILKARSGFGLTSTNSTGTIVSKSTDSFDWVKKVTSSDESVIKATASANAMEGTHKINVTQLASVARFTSGDLSSILNNNSRLDAGINGTLFTISNGEASAEIKLENAKVSASKVADLDFSGDNSLAFRVNGKEVSLSGNYSSAADLEAAIQTAIGEPASSGITVKINGEGKLEFKSIDSIVIDSSDMTAGDNPVLKITEKLGLTNGVTTGTNSINDVVKQINNSDTGLRANYDASLKKLMITSKEQGEGQKISITNVTGTFATSLNAESKYEEGKDAQIEFNGQIIKKSSNNFSVFGINLQLQAADASKEITINVESNVDGIMDKVKNFVEEYNTLIDNLNGMLKEKSYRDYQPLTKEEKEAMTEKEIELWEERAKSGLLKNDPSITRMLQSMRSGLYETIYEGDGTKLSGFNHITQIGITTGNYQSGGRLEINEEKLRKAIIDNPDGVVNLLFKKSDTKVIEGDKTSQNKNRAESGLVERIFSDMITNMKDIVRRSGTGNDASLYRSVQSNMLIDFVTNQSSISVLDKDLTSIGSRIAREERTLTSREQRYWSKFTAMEKALQSMNSQSSWLASQLGQM